MKNIKTVESNITTSNAMTSIIKGSIISIIITLIMLLIFSVILTYTKVGEETISPVIIVISGISIIIGSSMTTIKIKRKGIVNGAIIGIIYMMAIYIISSITTLNFSLNMYSIIMILTGIISRNDRRNSRRKHKVKKSE